MGEDSVTRASVKYGVGYVAAAVALRVATDDVVLLYTLGEPVVSADVTAGIEEPVNEEDKAGIEAEETDAEGEHSDCRWEGLVHMRSR